MPPDVVHGDLPASHAERRALALEIKSLPRGTNVVLSSRALASHRRLRRFARDAGVVLRREYFAIPSAAAPTCYVEDTPAAFRHFFSRILTLPRGGLAASGLLAAAKSAARFDWLRTALGATAASMLAVGRVSQDAAIAVASDHDINLLDVEGMHSVVLALSKDPNAKVTVLLIPSDGTQPSLAVKVATTEAAQASVDAERRVLLDLEPRLPVHVVSTIPRVTELPGWRSGLVTAAMPGTPMTGRYHAWRHTASRTAVSADFAMAERWLAAFQVPVGGPLPIDVDSAASEILARRFGPDPDFGSVIAKVRSLRSRLASAQTPRTPVHGDFWFGNLLVSGEDISGVVDWEAGAVAGEPAHDLVRFGLTYALYLDRHTGAGREVRGHSGLRAGMWGAGIEYAINGRGWFPDLFRGFIESGLSRLGADPALWRDAALAGLIDVAATADQADFARAHWRLFDRLCGSD